MRAASETCAERAQDVLRVRRERARRRNVSSAPAASPSPDCSRASRSSACDRLEAIRRCPQQLLRFSRDGRRRPPPPHS